MIYTFIYLLEYVESYGRCPAYSPSIILLCILIFSSKYLLPCEVVTANCIALCIKPHKRYFITTISKYFGSLTFFSCVQIVSVVYSNRIS